MKYLFEDMITSIKAQTASDSMSYAKFITEKTYIGGRRFSFLNHEFQEYICKVVEDNPGCTFSVMKCSQIGLSELFNRLILARMAVKPGTSVLISFPSIRMSSEVLKLRFSTVIRDSPALSGLIDRNNDSASVKAFVNGSVLYALGGSKQSNTSLLNRPISVVFVDEIDRQDPDIVTGYRSRMTHTPPEERLVINVSTPTVEGLGISAEIDDCGVVHTPWVGCPCGHEFVADFYEDVVLPGYEKSLRLLAKSDLARYRADKAYLKCPECGGKLDKTNQTIAWKVTRNPDAQDNRIGITLDPFCAPGFISAGDLVQSSVIFSSQAEFLNQSLGKCASMSDSSVNVSNINFIKKDNLAGQSIFGLDLGKQCFFMRGIVAHDTTVHIVEPRIINLPDLEEFLEEQFSKHTFAAAVMDSQPYSDLVYRLIKKYQRLYSAIYISPNPPQPQMYTLKMSDKYNEVVRQVTINKPMAMDTAVTSLNDFFTFEPSPLDGIIIKHFTDMRRVRDYRFEEIIYNWRKSLKGQDHFFHTFNYLHIAAKLVAAGLNETVYSPVVIKRINPDRLRRERRR